MPNRPHHPARSLLLALLLGAVAAAAALVGAAPAGATTTREARLVQRINHARAQHGLPALRLDAQLSAAARSHATSMAAQRLLFHTAAFPCCWDAMAENVATGFTVRGVHRSLMASALHRHNILDRRMRQVGVGVIVSGGRLWVTQVFRSPG